MKKVKMFMTKLIANDRLYEVDEQINDFVEENKVDIKVVGFTTFLDTYNNVVVTTALIEYEDIK